MSNVPDTLTRPQVIPPDGVQAAMTYSSTSPAPWSPSSSIQPIPMTFGGSADSRKRRLGGP